MTVDSASAARHVFVFSVTSLGDLALATLTFDLAAPTGDTSLTVVGPPAAAALLPPDARVAAVRVVRSSAPLTWRRETLRHLLAARRARASVVNLELYAPRFGFVRRAARLLRLSARTLDLAALRDDNARSAQGRPTALPHRAHHYARAFDHAGEPPAARLTVAPASRAALERRLRHALEHEALMARGDASLLARPRLVVHAGSSEVARRPPTALLAALVERLARASAGLTLLVGTSDELAGAMRLEAALARELPRLNLCARLPLAELPALTQGALAFVGGDSGPLKVAEASNVRTLSLWAPGATGPAFAGPRGAGHWTLPFDAQPAAVERATSALLRGA